MALTSSRLVTSGFFRVHLWVLLGVQTLAVLTLFAAKPPESAAWVLSGQFWLAMAAASLSYVGAVIWMYERAALGKAAIVTVGACALAGCVLPVMRLTAPEIAWQIADRISGGMLLGLVTTAMLLGHWYLNTPTMKLAPLQRLIVLLAAAVVVRMTVCGAGLMLAGGPFWQKWLAFIAL